MLHPVEAAARNVQEWRAGLSSIISSDAINPQRLFELLIGEIHEAHEEFQVGNKRLEVIELVDALVFLSSIVRDTLPNFEYQVLSYHPVALNGAGTKDHFYELVLEVAGHGRVGHEGEVVEVMALIVSRIRALGYYDKFGAVMEYVIEKNSANRPPRFYTVVDRSGKLLEGEMVVKKYTHVEMMLKILRKRYGSPLEPWMWQPFGKLIENFENSAAVAEQMRRELDVLDAWLVQAVLYDRTPESSKEDRIIFDSAHRAGALNSSRAREYSLQHAGGVLLGEPVTSD